MDGREITGEEVRSMDFHLEPEGCHCGAVAVLLAPMKKLGGDRVCVSWEDERLKEIGHRLKKLAVGNRRLSFNGMKNLSIQNLNDKEMAGR